MNMVEVDFAHISLGLFLHDCHSANNVTMQNIV